MGCVSSSHKSEKTSKSRREKAKTSKKDAPPPVASAWIEERTRSNSKQLSPKVYRNKNKEEARRSIRYEVPEEEDENAVVGQGFPASDDEQTFLMPNVPEEQSNASPGLLPGFNQSPRASPQATSLLPGLMAHTSFGSEAVLDRYDSLDKNTTSNPFVVLFPVYAMPVAKLGCHVCHKHLTGRAFSCKQCTPKFTVCDDCFVDELEVHDMTHDFEEIKPPPMENHTDSASNSVVSEHRCQGCDVILVGLAFLCEACPGFMLCAACFHGNKTNHDEHHKFTETNTSFVSPSFDTRALSPGSVRSSSVFEQVLGSPTSGFLPTAVSCSQCHEMDPDTTFVVCHTCPFVHVCLQCQPTFMHIHPLHVQKHVAHSRKIQKNVDEATGNKVINMYTVLKSIGAGSCGKVKLAQHIQSRKLFAIKIFNKSFLSKKKAGLGTRFDKVQMEIAIMKRMDHPNVVKLIEVIDDPDCNKLYLILEYVERGAIFQLGTQSALSPAQIKFYALQIGHGLQYLHKNLIIHRDVKPENILVDECGIPKLADFGASSWNQGEDGDDFQGTPAFMAPEVLMGITYPGPMLDLWAFGVTLYVFAYGKMPWNLSSMGTLHSSLGTHVNYEGDVDADLKDLLQQMLHMKRENRLDLEGFFRHRFIAEGTRQNLLTMKEYAPIRITDEDARGAVVVGSNVTLRFARTIGVFLKVVKVIKNLKMCATPKCSDLSPGNSLVQMKPFAFGDAQSNKVAPFRSHSPKSGLLVHTSKYEAQITEATPVKSLKIANFVMLEDTSKSTDIGAVAELTNDSEDDEDFSSPQASPRMTAFTSDPRRRSSYNGVNSMYMFGAHRFPGEEKDYTDEEKVATILSDSSAADIVLDGCPLPALPPDLFRLTLLAELSCSHCGLHSLCPEIEQLVHLTVLSASDNELTTIPKEIALLTHLTKLDLSRNKLSELPPEVGSLTHLVQVVLDGNCFEEVPRQLCDIVNLQNLYIVENLELRRFPVELSNLHKCILAIDNSPALFRTWAIVYGHFPGVQVTWNKIFPDRVQEHLFLGSLRTAQNPHTYSSLGVTRVLTCGRGLQIISPLPIGVEQIEVPLDDNVDEDMRPFFESLADMIEKWRMEHRIILVHCFAGISRSVTCIVAYLMLKRSRRMVAALEHVQMVRPIVRPNDAFMAQLKKLDEDLAAKGHYDEKTGQKKKYCF